MRYYETWPKHRNFPLENVRSISEDSETLATIDEGMRDAREGRIVPAEEVRKLLREWVR
jgi:predicted transcriptional regulator